MWDYLENHFEKKNPPQSQNRTNDLGMTEFTLQSLALPTELFAEVNK